MRIRETGSAAVRRGPRQKGTKMTRQTLTFFLGVGAILLAAQTAVAGPSNKCAPRGTVVGHLADKYGEARRAIGLAGQNQVVEVYASDETGTWTILVTSPAGISCLVASGDSFEALADQVAAAQGDAL